MPAYLNVSSARRHFKKMLGGANHLIITALVGLDAIERGVVTEIPHDIHAAWSPKDAAASSKRTRRLILDMALVRAVDALDVYIRHSRRKPSLIQSQALQREIDGAGLSVFRRFAAVEKHLPGIDRSLAALMAVMITWRNRSAHAEADTEISERHQSALRDNAAGISSRFRGLSAELLLSGYKEHRPPVFKEIASFINATHHFVEELEQAHFAAVDTEAYLKQLIWTAISRTANDTGPLETMRKRHLQSVWGKDSTERKLYVERFLYNHGLTATKARDAVYPLAFSDDLLARLVAMRASEVFVWSRDA
jgi:hypothetical protein